MTQSLSVSSFSAALPGLGTGAVASSGANASPGGSPGAAPGFANALNASLGAGASGANAEPGQALSAGATPLAASLASPVPAGLSGYLSTVSGRAVVNAAAALGATQTVAEPTPGSTPARVPELTSGLLTLTSAQPGEVGAPDQTAGADVLSSALPGEAALAVLQTKDPAIDAGEGAADADPDDNGEAAAALLPAVTLAAAFVSSASDGGSAGGPALAPVASPAAAPQVTPVTVSAPGAAAPLLAPQAGDGGFSASNATPLATAPLATTAQQGTSAPAPATSSPSALPQATLSPSEPASLQQLVASQAQVSAAPDASLQSNPVLNTLAALVPPQARPASSPQAGSANPAAPGANAGIDPATATNANTSAGAASSALSNGGGAPSFADGLAQALDGADSARAPSSASSGTAGIALAGDGAGPVLPGSTVSTPVQQAAQQAAQQATQQPTQQPTGQQPLPQGFTTQTLPSLTAAITRQVSGGREGFTVQLNPSELGRVDIRLISNDDGSTQATVRVERTETLDLFQRDLRFLERALQQSGIRLSGEGIDLSLKDNGSSNGNQSAFSGASSDGGASSGNDRHGEAARSSDDTNRHSSTRLLIDDIAAVPTGDIIQTVYARFTPGRLNIEV